MNGLNGMARHMGTKSGVQPPFLPPTLRYQRSLVVVLLANLSGSLVESGSTTASSQRCDSAALSKKSSLMMHASANSIPRSMNSTPASTSGCTITTPSGFIRSIAISAVDLPIRLFSSPRWTHHLSRKKPKYNQSDT